MTVDFVAEVSKDLVVLRFDLRLPSQVLFNVLAEGGEGVEVGVVLAQGATEQRPAGGRRRVVEEEYSGGTGRMNDMLPRDARGCRTGCRLRSLIQ